MLQSVENTNFFRNSKIILCYRVTTGFIVLRVEKEHPGQMCECAFARDVLFYPVLFDNCPHFFLAGGDNTLYNEKTKRFQKLRNISHLIAPLKI